MLDQELRNPVVFNPYQKGQAVPHSWNVTLKADKIFAGLSDPATEL